MRTSASLLLLSNSLVGLNGFQSNNLGGPSNIKNYRLENTRLQMNFFKDLINSAFENDKNLSSEIEGPNDTDIFDVQGEKTEVQKKWIESQMNANKSNVVNDGKGAPMNAKLLPGTKWELALYLTGVPNFDPSNSLYGSKVNISNRDSGLSKDGFAIGADTLPDETSVTLQITLMEDGVCKVDESAFTTGMNGEWKLSDDGRIIRFSLDCTGYQRTVTTKGTIQNVYWSDRQEAERKSSAVYEIPPGQIFAEARVGFGNTPGVFVMGDENNPEGILKIEKSQGVFGVTTKLFACGKFAAKMITDEE